MKEPTGIAFHTQRSQPVPAHRLPEAPPRAAAAHPIRLLHRWHGCRGRIMMIGRGGGGIRVRRRLDYGYGCSRVRGARIQPALEIKA